MLAWRRIKCENMCTQVRLDNLKGFNEKTNLFFKIYFIALKRVPTYTLQENLYMLTKHNSIKEYFDINHRRIMGIFRKRLHGSYKIYAYC